VLEYPYKLGAYANLMGRLNQTPVISFDVTSFSHGELSLMAATIALSRDLGMSF
jgi:hypothetical protein